MTLIRELGSLESAGLIRVAQAEPELEYLFRHTLVQDAAYASILGEDRKRLHRLVGETIEEMYPHRTDELASRLAQHFDIAGEADRAMRYYQVAGEAALSSFASSEAESHFRRALQLQEESLDKAQILKSLGIALYQQGRLQEALEVMWEGIELCKVGGPESHDLMANLYSRAARFAWGAGDTPGGLKICEEGMVVLEGAEETKGYAMLLHETARAYYFNGIADKALPLCERAIQIAERIGAKGVLADSLATYGILPSLSTQVKLEALHRAVKIAEANGILHVAHRAHHNLGTMISVLKGDERKASEHYLRAAEISRERGVEEEVLYSLFQAYYAKLNFGEIREVEEILPSLEARIERLPEKNIAVMNLLGMKSGLALAKGEWSKAQELIQTAIKEARRQGDLQFLRSYLLFQGWLELEIARCHGGTVPPEVIVEVEESIDLGDQRWGRSVEERALLAQILTLNGNLEKAHAWLTSGWESVGESENLSELATLEIAAGLLAKSESRWEEAFSYFEAAAVKRARFGQKLMWASVLDYWGETHIAREDPGDLQRAQALLRESNRLLKEIGSPGYIELSESKLETLRTKITTQVEAGEQAVEDIARAKEIQQSFLPESIPELPALDVAAILLPARQISGDFYDFITLPEGKLGIVIADVADKGPAAALYMTSTRTLIRTYSSEYPEDPDRVMVAVNKRIMGETHSGLFVTTFYGVLDPQSKTLRYCNAGHNPPLRVQQDGSIERLRRTGLPLGIYEDVNWEQSNVNLNPEDVLVMYTDGVTDGQDTNGDFYGDKRLLKVVRSSRQGSAAEICASILDDQQSFTRDTPQFDDLTLLLLKCAQEGA
jgi:serine phosphatase RsbU (regulator of sigma subunit)/uncharacterized protein HemY